MIKKPDHKDDVETKTLYFKASDGNDVKMVYQKTLYIHFDTIAPTLIVQKNDVTDENAIIYVTPNEDGNLYYLEKTGENVEEPTAEAIKDHNPYSLFANQKSKITIRSLAAYTPYTIYFVAKDKAGNLSEVKSVSFTTRKTSYKGKNPVFGQQTGTGADTAIAITTPENETLQYSLDNGNTWTDLKGTSIPVGNKSYDEGMIQVRVKETDDTKAGDAVSYEKAIRGTLEGSVAITGTIKCDKTITATVTGAQNNAKLKYQFFRVKGDQSISLGNASTANTYTLTQDDIGSKIEVKVTADNYDGELVSAETSEVPRLKHDPLSLIVAVAANAEGTKKAQSTVLTAM